MANATSSYHLGSSELAVTMLSGVLGAGSAIANSLIFLSITKYQALRDDKEYLLLMALAIADTINMMGYVALRICEVVMVGVYNFTWFLPARQCLLLPHMLLFMLGYPLSNIMLMVISLDRLLLIAKPEAYIHLGTGYMKGVLGCVYGGAIALTLLGVAHIWLLGEASRLCIGYLLAADAEGIFYLFPVYFNQTAMAAAVVSVFIYCLILPIYMCTRGKVLPSDNDQQKTRKLNRQRKMTITLGISCLCTFLLYILPARLTSLFDSESGYTTLGNKVMWLVTQTNSLANIFIYELRHPELWVALKGLLGNKELPQNLQLWPNNNPHNQISLM